MTIELTALKGTNPLGLFAALGVLDVATRNRDPQRPVPRLWWTDDLEPEARLEGIATLDELIELIDFDRARWVGSPVLEPMIDGVLQDDVKLSTATRAGSRDDRSPLRQWMERVYRDGDDADIALLHALVAEGATMGTSVDAKPTHFHFTAGQQKFLQMVRDLRDNVTRDDLAEALVGPWRFERPLPMLGWDTSRGDRIYALRGYNPSSEKKHGVPGAEWVGFLGLRFFPVATRVVRGRAQLVTAGCEPGWKRGAFTWPLWGRGSVSHQPGLTAPVVRCLLVDEAIHRMPQHHRELLGVTRVLRAPITRSDQGGYGSFGPAADRVSTSDRVTAMVL